jgi:uncharacterized membrane protein YoaK (UPF0700 family)
VYGFALAAFNAGLIMGGVLPTWPRLGLIWVVLLVLIALTVIQFIEARKRRRR